MKNKLLILISALFISFGVQAHQPDLSSTLLVEQSENNWVLQVRASLTAFEYEVEQHFGKSSYATPEEFQDLVLKHLLANISIQYNNDQNVVLQNGKVKLGHETTVTFEVAGTPETMQLLAVNNSSFKEISRNKNALMVIKKGIAREQFILDNKNQHSVKLKVNDTDLEVITPTTMKAEFPLLILGSICLVLTIFIFAYKKKQTAEVIPVAVKG